jgi:hypothetical protein
LKQQISPAIVAVIVVVLVAIIGIVGFKMMGGGGKSIDKDGMKERYDRMTKQSSGGNAPGAQRPSGPTGSP